MGRRAAVVALSVGLFAACTSGGTPARSTHRVHRPSRPSESPDLTTPTTRPVPRNAGRPPHGMRMVLDAPSAEQLLAWDNRIYALVPVPGRADRLERIVS